VLFYEYFHGDNGAGLGASHQNGVDWPRRDVNRDFRFGSMRLSFSRAAEPAHLPRNSARPEQAAQRNLGAMNLQVTSGFELCNHAIRIRSTRLHSCEFR